MIRAPRSESELEPGSKLGLGSGIMLTLLLLKTKVSADPIRKVQKPSRSHLLSWKGSNRIRLVR